MGMFFLSCGLPNTEGIVPEASGVTVRGDTVTFTLTESSGFFLYYRFYRSDEIPLTDLSEVVMVGEEAIFSALRHHKAYPATGAVRRRFIWQPSATDTGPYTVQLSMVEGTVEVRDSSMTLILQENLLRTTLISFGENRFRVGDADMVAGVETTAQIAWATMNTRLDPAIFVLSLSNATFLGNVAITVN